MASIKKVLDLDAQLGLDLSAPTETKKVKLLGREWTIVCDINSFAISDIMTGDAGGIARFIRGVVVEDEADAFAAALGKVRNLDAEKLGSILNALVEVAAERPTEQPSPARRTAGSQTSVQKSRPRSSSPGAASAR